MEQPITTKNVGQPCVICGQAADAQATIAALQARVQELEGITKVICGHCCEPMEILSKAVLQSQLTQRTAELEAATHTAQTFQSLWRDACDQRDKAQAELERVRGERDHAKKMGAVQKEVADNQTWHVQKLRTLIAANKETKHDAI